MSEVTVLTNVEECRLSPVMVDSVTLAKGSVFECNIDRYRTNYQFPESDLFCALIEEILELKRQVEELKRIELKRQVEELKRIAE